MTYTSTICIIEAKKGGYNLRSTMNKVKTTLNLSPEVLEMFKQQAREKGLDNSSYLTYLVHEQNKQKEFQEQLKQLFLSMLKNNGG